MANSVERSCTMLVHNDKPATPSEIKEALEGNDNTAKVSAMKKAIMMLLAGEQIPQLFITIVRYVLPSEDHTVQKLLLLYLEAIEKTDSEGKLLPEMILICQNLRNNLQHPNEYIRGVTLRFLCRIKEEEILEPLIPSILTNLEHRHSYVRRNAVLAINSIYKLPKGELLLQDSPEAIDKLLRTEQDLSTKRNAFLMLINHAEDLAVQYLLQNLENIPLWGDILQMTALELIRKVCATHPAEKSRYIRVILTLLQSPSHAVVYDCAQTLTSLSSSPAALRAAAKCYCQLLVAQSDNNVKLIVLERLQELKVRGHREVLQEVLMDVLRALGSPNMDIRAKTLEIAMDLLTSKNIGEVVTLLKKEIVKTQNRDLEKGAEYRQLLVQTIHACALRFPEVAGGVVHLLMDFLGDPNAAAALDVAHFVREIIETNPKLRTSILERLRDIFPQVRAPRVAACALWVLGEFSTSRRDVDAALEAVKTAIGAPKLKEALEAQEETAAAAAAAATVPTGSKRPAVLADGTYATQAAVAETPMTVPASLAPPLRALLQGGDFFLGGVVAATFVKLVLRLKHLLAGSEPVHLHHTAAEAMLYLSGILGLGEGAPKEGVSLDGDSRNRILNCLAALAGQEEQFEKVWLEQCRQSFSGLAEERRRREAARARKEEGRTTCQPDDPIDFRILRARGKAQDVEPEPTADSNRVDASVAAASAAAATADGSFAEGKTRVVQLTGLSDPVFAEARVTVHHYDVLLEVSVTNRTRETLQGLSLELATMGDLKLVERPQSYNIAAGDTKVIHANIKVSSTETGVIFGNIVYEGGGCAEHHVVVLSDIHVDVMDYIYPAHCEDAQFRAMWAEFEWENKVAVNTTITDVAGFLQHIVEATHMKCLTPPSALEGECGYLAANLYAKSVFGEDALVNVSLEQLPDRHLVGYIRIRSKTQGIALSLGDKITVKQKLQATPSVALERGAPVA